MDREELHAYNQLRKSIATHSQDKATFKEHMSLFLEGMCEDGHYGGAEMFEKDHEDSLSRYEVAQHHTSANIDMIYQYAESPIELLFLCNFLLMSFRFSPFFATITPPLVVDEAINEASTIHKKFAQIRKRARKQGEPEVVDVLHRLQTEKKAMEFTKRILPAHIGYLGDDPFKFLGYLDRGLGGSFHISLQPSFASLQVEGRTIRPDMVIWYPQRSDFRLIVECDGYAYHSDKETFSKDRIRDRTLQQQGYQVFRFSGHEIVQNATLKVDQFIDYLFDLSEKFDLPVKKLADEESENREGDDQNHASHSPARKKKPVSGEQKKRQRHAQRKNR